MGVSNSTALHRGSFILKCILQLAVTELLDPLCLL